MALELLKSGARPRTIATAINSSRRRNGRKGIVKSKDIVNAGSDFKRSNSCKVVKSEEQLIAELIDDQRAKDPGGTFEILRSKNGDNTMEMIFIMSSKMKENFENHPRAIYIDSAYKINSLNFCLYALIAEDDNGFGRPVCLALLKNERADLITSLCNKIKEESPAWLLLQVIYVKRNFNQKAKLLEAFPDSVILMHSLYVIRLIKSQIFKVNLTPINDKVSLLDSFKSIVYSQTEKEFRKNQISFLSLCPNSLREFYRANLAKDPKAWCLAFNPDRQAPASHNSSRVESFFLTLKTALTGSCSTIAKNFKMSKCLDVIFNFLTSVDEHLEPSVIKESLTVNTITVGQQFTSFAEAHKAVKSFAEATNQVFFIGSGCPRTKKTSPVHEKFPYSSPRFVCKHSGVYKPHRDGKNYAI